MAGGARPSLWRTPTPYLFLGFAFMMGLIAVALLVLICTRRKRAPRYGGVVSRGESTQPALKSVERFRRVLVCFCKLLAWLGFKEHVQGKSFMPSLKSDRYGVNAC
ncbi:protein GLUTAMINE DUMPER 4-like [Panicum miliaceum]|uniref:Protein GLUTAMINE DUMPER 4-like n=1 Tax=Panicum miliaceum TaxID=4540 RepID=A0A3L6PDJ3_PANMI|nr:protein GLUTAMINE DUMPER 4-like [Panicum miliaceum]